VLPIARLSAVPTEDGWWTRPFILPELRGKSRRERAANASKLEDALRAAFPDGRAEYYPGGMVHSGVKPTFLPLGDALTRVRGPAGEAGKAYLQLNLSPADWEKMLELSGTREPAFISSAVGTLPGAACTRALERAGKLENFHLETHWRMMIMGGGVGAGMFLHPDTLRTSSWQLQIRGRKRWHLCPGRGGPEKAASTYCGAADIDTFDPDYSKCPSFRSATCYEGVIGPGEALYYPEDYWHQTRALDSGNAAISGTLVSPSNGALVAQELQKECDGASRIIARGSTELCNALRVCFDGWRKMVR